MSYFLKNGTPVNVGDDIIFTKEKTNKFGLVKKTTTITVTEDNLNILIKEGIIFKNNPTLPKEPASIEEVKHHLAVKNNMSDEAFNAFFKQLECISPISAFRILFKELADTYNNRYKYNYTWLHSIYLIDINNGEITSIATPQDYVLKYSMYTYSRRDMNTILTILKPLYDKVFK